MWKLNIIPEDFLVKHFAAERFNVENGRIHTLVTHAFSHHGIFSLCNYEEELSFRCFDDWIHGQGYPTKLSQ